MVWLIFLLLNLVSFLEVNSLNDFNKSDFDRKSKVLFVHVLFRHGDRSPLKQNPGDPYDITYWPDGWGQLTNVGKRQEYEHGKWLRARYYDFISSLYRPDEIYVQSSDVDRTLMSALSSLAGLYTPEGSQIWHPQLLWQPIPVHTKPVDTDYLIAGKVPSKCMSYQKSLLDYQESPEFLAELRKAESFCDYVSAQTNSTVDDFLTLLWVRDSWVCETAHNLPIPKWAAPLYPNNEKFYKAALMGHSMTTATPHLAKFYSGFLLKDILDRLTSKVAKTLQPDRKFWMYSTHDSSVFGFLNALGVSDNKFPEYTATIIVELRSYENENYVQLFYKNRDADPHVINIPGCGYACALEKMHKIYDNIIPKLSFDVECQIDE